MNSHGLVIDDKQSNSLQLVEAGTVKLVKIPQFLSTDDKDTLLGKVMAHKEAFHPPGVPGNYIGDGTSLMLDLDFGKKPSEQSLVDVVCECLSARIMEQLPALLETLGLKPFDIDKCPMTIISGLNGHYGLPHIDTYSPDMKITILYYFHNSPKAYRGGDLELFESDPDTSFGYKEQPVIRIEHEDNLLLAFTSDTYHGVTEVESDVSTFEDSRFTTVSFIRSL